MNIPVFRHTLNTLKAISDSQKASLGEISGHFLSDPGLLFNLFIYVKEKYPAKDFHLVQSALSIIGEQGLEYLMQGSDTALGEEYRLLWSYGMLIRSAAEDLNKNSAIAEYDLVVTSALIPIAGIMIMLKKYPKMKELLPLLLKLNTEDRIFIQERLFSSNHMREMEIIENIPDIYKGIIYLAGFVFSREGKRLEELDHPSRFSEAYTRYELFKLMEVAESAAQSILFPQVIEAQERCKESLKKHFLATEADFEDYLASVIGGFEARCAEYALEDLPSEILKGASSFGQSGFSFKTTSAQFNQELERIYEANRQGRNILVWGEPDVGKRLLLASLHQRRDNPNRNNPFISVYCSGITEDSFESELFGAKGGFGGFEKHRGALDIVKEGGTALLKNIDKMPLALQDRLALNIKEGRFFRVGETKAVDFQCRIFMSSRSHPEDSGLISKSLMQAVEPVILRIPPLRERRLDIEMIADAIISKYNLPIYDSSLMVGLKEYYEGHAFGYNLLDLKRLLFYVSARSIISRAGSL